MVKVPEEPLSFVEIVQSSYSLLSPRGEILDGGCQGLRDVGCVGGFCLEVDF